VASFVDADAFVRWEKGEFDLPGWMESHLGEGEPALFPATVWQQLHYGVYAWEAKRAAKRSRFLSLIRASVVSFSRRHAVRAAQLAAELKAEDIGVADFQVAATVIEDGGELLTFNRDHFERLPALRLVDV